MADTKLAIFNNDAQTAYIDMRTESTNLEGRQVIVLGDPASNNAVAAVQATDPASNTEGIVVRDVNTSAIVSKLSSTLAVSLDPGHTLGSISGIGSSIGVYFDRGNPSVNINSQTSTLNVQLDPGHELGSIKAINTSVQVVPTTGSSHSMSEENYNAQRVFFAGSNPNSSLVVNAGTGSFNVQFDPGHTLGKVEPGVGTFQVFLPDTGHEIGTIRGNSNTLTVFLPDTGHTLGKVDAGGGTFNVALDPGHTIGNLGSLNSITTTVNVQLDPGHTLGFINGTKTTLAVSIDPGYTLGKVDQGVASTTQPWLINTQGTASVFTASGSVSGVSVSGNTIISPSVNASFKVFSFSLQTTGQVSLTCKFTNGSGTSPTEFYRPLITAAGVTGAQGANLASAPFAPLFITGTSTTLALVLDSASLVHYSVSYLKESA